MFPAETVQASRERQAALLTGERLLEQLQGAEARAAALEEVGGCLRWVRIHPRGSEQPKLNVFFGWMFGQM